MASVLITGASSGIGAATALELARGGWRVFAGVRTPELSQNLASRAAEGGGKLDLVRLDVTKKASVDAAVAQVLGASGGRLDAIVHNAGIAAGGAFEDLDEATVRGVMETNFFGVLALTRALLPTLRAQRRGRVVVISSDAAFAGEPGNAIYCASKWALEGWAESMCFELAPFGIEVACVEPGPYRTEIWKSSPWCVPIDSPYRAWVTRLRANVEAHVRRTARDPDEVARAVRRLLASRRMPFRTPVGPLSRLGHAMRGKLPTAMIRASVVRYLGLDRG